MENSKLMHILIRDISEVEQLTREIRQNQSYDAMDMELLVTRISGVRHLLEVAAGIRGKTEENRAGEEPQRREDVPPPAGKDPRSIHSGLTGQVTVDPGISKQKETAHNKPLITTAIELKDPVSSNGGYKTPAAPELSLGAENSDAQQASGKIFRQVIDPSAADAGPLTPKESEKPVVPDVSPRDLGLEEEQTLFPEKQILGERFVAGKSLNDLLLEKGISDPKFASMPVSSLASAIRTNDKFLFSRELFDGNMDNLIEAISKIDSMQSLQEAATFLHDNFRWKKSETSLKFIDLVKRRFLS